MGGKLVQKSYINSEFTEKYSSEEISHQAKLSFDAKMKGSASASFNSQSDKEIRDNYLKSVSEDQITAVGGEWIIGMSVDTWLDSVENDPMPIFQVKLKFKGINEKLQKIGFIFSIFFFISKNFILLSSS